jgi:hypothetical protein
VAIKVPAFVSPSPNISYWPVSLSRFNINPTNMLNQKSIGQHRNQSWSNESVWDIPASDEEHPKQSQLAQSYKQAHRILTFRPTRRRLRSVLVIVDILFGVQWLERLSSSSSWVHGGPKSLPHAV